MHFNASKTIDIVPLEVFILFVSLVGPNLYFHLKLISHSNLERFPIETLNVKPVGCML